MHAGDVAVVDAAGDVVASAGDHDRPVYARSSMKPLQAAVALSVAGLDLPDREVAVMSASHNAEAAHVGAVRSLLARAGVPEGALQCPSVRPWDEETARAHPEPLPVNSDCSGKHAGMLAACRAQGWPLETYREAGHPLQLAVERTVVSVTGLASVHVGVDGCGVPVHGLPLAGMASIYARLATPDLWGVLEPHARRVGDAMRAEPYMVAGRGRVDTAVMAVAPHLVVKGGAEGLLCASVFGRDLGIAVKVHDGSARAAGPALIHVLRMLGLVDPEALLRLEPFVRPPVLGGGRPVGEVVAEFTLQS